MITKEINYLSLPDHFNRYLYTNYNQKFDKKGKICIEIQVNSTKNIGYALKAIVQLELVLPRKINCVVLRISKKQTFNKKSQNIKIFKFQISMKSYEFLNIMRYFLISPFANKMDILPLVTRKLKNFDLKYTPKISIETTKSFEYLKMYHLN